MKTAIRTKSLTVALAITAFLLAGISGCSKDSSTENSSGAQGDVKIYLVDDPSDYDAVNIVVTEVSVHVTSSDSMSGWMVINGTTRTINLLNLTNGNYDILGTGRLDVGQYSQVRLKIGTGSNVVVNGQVHPLDIPSGAQSGLKLNHPFTILADSLYELTLDFDVSRSIHETGNGQYMMRPVIRVVANVVSGSISGIVNPALTFGLVSAISGPDTMTTYANFVNGGFMLVALPSGTYTVIIRSGVDTYADSTITGVAVLPRQNTNLGTINLRHL